MTPEPRPCPVSSCTTEGSRAFATAATGSSPALICDGVTATGMPGPPEPIALALELPRSRSWPSPNPAPMSSTTARTPATRRDVRRPRGGRSPPPVGGVPQPQPGPAPDASGIGRVSPWLQGGAVLAAPHAEPGDGQPSAVDPADPAAGPAGPD